MTPDELIANLVNGNRSSVADHLSTLSTPEALALVLDVHHDLDAGTYGQLPADVADTKRKLRAAVRLID